MSQGKPACLVLRVSTPRGAALLRGCCVVYIHPRARGGLLSVGRGMPAPLVVVEVLVVMVVVVVAVKVVVMVVR